MDSLLPSRSTPSSSPFTPRVTDHPQLRFRSAPDVTFRSFSQGPRGGLSSPPLDLSLTPILKGRSGDQTTPFVPFRLSTLSLCPPVETPNPPLESGRLPRLDPGENASEVDVALFVGGCDSGRPRGDSTTDVRMEEKRSPEKRVELRDLQVGSQFLSSIQRRRSFERD